MARLRLGFGRIAQETNALSPVYTTLDDFRATHWLEGAELLAACQPKGYEAQGFIKAAELSGCVKATLDDGQVDAIPTLSAWTVPSGALTQDAFDHLVERLIAQLRDAGKLDGVFLSLHGAMNVLGVPDPDAAICERVRDALGVPLGVTLDLHANLNPRIVAATDVLVGYKTNPHRDHKRVGYKATQLLLKHIRGQVVPVTAWRSLPMLLGGGLSIDFLQPMRSAWRTIKKYESDPRVLDVSLFQCHPWNDTPELGWAALATVDGDPVLAEQIADEVAELAWGLRHELPPEIPSAEDVLEEARAARLARNTGCVCVCDASDVVAAGAPGENTRLLQTLIERGDGLLCYVPLRDPAVVDALWDAPIGSKGTWTVGGKLDPQRNQSLDVTGSLVWKGDRQGFGKTAVLDLGHVKLVLTHGPAMAMKPSFYSEVGLPPLKADVVVVKSFFPFRLFFGLHNRKTLYCRTSGVTDFDAAKGLDLVGDLHPFQTVDDWRPADRRRRGLDAPS